ncbi:MAG: hypothetical protein ACRD1E_06540 [Terriglobales bacterium]
MALALAITLLCSWLFLWGIFHLAGSACHIALALGLALLAWRVVRASHLRSE